MAENRPSKTTIIAVDFVRSLSSSFFRKILVDFGRNLEAVNTLNHLLNHYSTNKSNIILILG